MLLQLTVGNFLSFKDNMTFSAIAVNNSDREIDDLHGDRLLAHPFEEGISILPISAIYGANGAGKSNLVKAVKFAKDLVVEGTRSDRMIPVYPFKLGNYSKQPSNFEFIFVRQGVQYSYGFRLDREQIFEEWLYSTFQETKEEVIYFERITSSAKETTIELGSQLKEKSDKSEQFLEFVAQGTRPNQLFLTEAIDRNVEALRPVMDWFSEVLAVVSAGMSFGGSEILSMKDKSFFKFLEKSLRLVGTGVDKIKVVREKFDSENHLSDLPSEVIDPIRNGLVQEQSEAGSDRIAMLAVPGKRYFFVTSDEDEFSVVQLKTQHRDEEGELVDFAIEEESDGTQRLINLIPILFALKEKDEIVVFFDELDRRLHPLLSQYFIRELLDCRGASNQLFFTTHDTNLLDLELFRRDEIWFVEKNRKGASSLYSLAEFHIQQDIKVEKGYLNGRFGAIPFFGESTKTSWWDEAARSQLGDRAVRRSPLGEAIKQ